jgi:hypothetical protein
MKTALTLLHTYDACCSRASSPDRPEAAPTQSASKSVESFLKDVVPAAVRREVDDTAAAQRDDQYSDREEERRGQRTTACTRRAYGVPLGPWRLRDSPLAEPERSAGG